MRNALGILVGNSEENVDSANQCVYDEQHLNGFHTDQFRWCGAVFLVFGPVNFSAVRGKVDCIWVLSKSENL